MKLEKYILRIDQLTLPARIGVYPEEYSAPQTVIIDVHLIIMHEKCDLNTAEGVPCYATLSGQVAEMLLAEHTPLCEQLAKKIAVLSFHDPRVSQAKITIHKPDAVPQAEVGITMRYCR